MEKCSDAEKRVGSIVSSASGQKHTKKFYAGQYPFEKVADMITEILKTTIYDGKGIEVNTSTVRYGLEGWMPSWDILKRYRELGGEILTVGSDSHAQAHLGSNIPKAMLELRDFGFRYICTFENMSPVFHKL